MNKMLYALGISAIVVLSFLIISVFQSKFSNNNNNSTTNNRQINQNINNNNFPEIVNNDNELIKNTDQEQERDNGLETVQKDSNKDNNNHSLNLFTKKYFAKFLKSDKIDFDYDFYVNSTEDINGFQIRLKHNNSMQKFKVNEIFDAKLEENITTELLSISYGKLNNINKENTIKKFIENETYYYLFSIKLKENTSLENLNLIENEDDKNIVILKNGKYGILILK